MKKRARVYRLEPVGTMDRGDARVMRHAGADVQIIQPVGCPRNGMMGMTYVQTLGGHFIGLVSKASLVKTDRIVDLRDLAAEVRDARSKIRSLHR